jgi:hypothetical protein
MNMKRLAVAITASALLAFAFLAAIIGPWASPQAALAAKSISVKASTLVDPACEGTSEEWHFVITQIDKASNAPASISVKWDNGATAVVPLQKFTGGTAHYSTTLNLDANVTNATASIYDAWKGQFNLSHGPCPPPLEVSKTATTTFTRTYTWEIEKSVDPATLNLFTGDSGSANYVVSVKKTGYVDSDWAVSGTITIHNAATSITAHISSVTDAVPGLVGTVTINCSQPVPGDLAPGATMTCTYSASTNGTAGTNTATVETTGKVAGGSGTAAVTYGSPTTEVNAEIHVSDSMQGDLGAFTGDDSVQYSHTFTCDEDEGEQTNTATIVETGQNDSAVVTVNCYALTVTKTAETSFARSYTWDIAKSVDQSSLDLGVDGTSATANYTVDVSVSGHSDSNFVVSGVITISNPAPMDAPLVSVTDNLAGLSPDVDCPSLTVPAGGTLECTYSASVDSADSGTNTATATLQNTPSGTTDFTGSVEFAFTDPSLLIDECVDVTDTYAGTLGTVCVSDAPKSFTYSRTFTRDDLAECGVEYTFDNTATFQTNDSGTTGSDDASVVVIKRCALIFGCSPGYYKTHDIGLNDTSMSDFGFNFDPSVTFQVALEANGGGINQLMRQSAAAFLNAYFDLSGFPYSTDEVVSLTNAAIASGDYSIADTFADYNHGSLATGGCPLN